MSNQYRAQMVNSANMANNPLGINVDDNSVRKLRCVTSDKLMTMPSSAVTLAF